MRVQSVLLWIAVAGTLTSWSAHGAAGQQQVALAARAPRFFFAPSTAANPVEIDASGNAVLSQVISLHAGSSTIGDLLAEIQRQTGLTFAYDPRFPATRPVTLEAESISVAAALGAIVAGTRVDVVLVPTGHVWLTESQPRSQRVQEGAIAGRVTDKQTGEPILGANVLLDPTGQITTSGTDGRYRFADLSLGSYRVRSRYIGYVSLEASVLVRADQEVTVDFPLERSAQQLDQIVTTGTVVPTEVKALPTPVSVISAEEIALQRPHTVQQLFRQAVPTAVSWDVGAVPWQTAFSVRGASTLTVGAGQVKVFVDGIEMANLTTAAVDPTSIQRIEVLRGPQAAAIYGSDAIGGVIQVFTKRGDPSLTRPQVDVQPSYGLIQTPYAGYGGVLRQSYTASFRGGGPGVSYNFGGGYTHTADNLPNGEVSRQSTPSIYGGVQFARGIIAGDVSGRYLTQNSPSVFNPALTQTGFSFWSKPFFAPQQLQSQTLGTRISVAPRSWWRNTLNMGIDRVTHELDQSRARLTTPGDTLLQVFTQNQTKSSIALNTSVQGSLTPALSGSLTLGFDHYALPISQFFTSSALNTTGAIQTVSGTGVLATQTRTTNTGYFAQAQFGFRDVLFLTAGLRAEKNTEFGDSLGTPVSPRAGISYVHQIGGATLKLRGSYGRAVRAPGPGRKLAAVSSSGVTLENPALGPERQKGWDSGIDAVFGSRASLSVSYYDQTADNLIDFVLIEAAPVRTSQYQNIGRVKNTGAEVEGTLYFGAVQLKGQYGYTRSRIDQLAPNYAGDLRVGDQSLYTPKHTAGASLAFTPFRGTTVSGGLTYVGSWRGFDWLAFYSCFGQTGPCRSTSRDYIIEYPSLTKVNASVSQQITRMLSGFISIDNLTNNKAYEVWNAVPVMGRISTVGLRFQY